MYFDLDILPTITGGRMVIVSVSAFLFVCHLKLDNTKAISNGDSDRHSVKVTRETMGAENRVTE